MTTLRSVFQNSPAIGNGVPTRSPVVNPGVNVSREVDVIDNPPAVGNGAQLARSAVPAVRVPNLVNAIEHPTRQVPARQNAAAQNVAHLTAASQNNVAQSALLHTAPSPAIGSQVPVPSNNAPQSTANIGQATTTQHGPSLSLPDRPTRGIVAPEVDRAWFDNLPDEVVPHKSDARKNAAQKKAPQTTGRRERAATPPRTIHLGLPTPPESPLVNNNAESYWSIQQHTTRPEVPGRPIVIAGGVDSSVGDVGAEARGASREAGYADTETEAVLDAPGCGGQLAAGDGDGDYDDKAGKVPKGTGCGGSDGKVDAGGVSAAGNGKDDDNADKTPEGTGCGGSERTVVVSGNPAPGLWAGLVALLSEFGAKICKMMS